MAAEPWIDPVGPAVCQGATACCESRVLLDASGTGNHESGSAGAPDAPVSLYYVVEQVSTVVPLHRPLLNMVDEEPTRHYADLYSLRNFSLD